MFLLFINTSDVEQIGLQLKIRTQWFKKLYHYTFIHNSDKCWPIFVILSLLHSPRNLQKNNAKLPKTSWRMQQRMNFENWPTSVEVRNKCIEEEVFFDPLRLLKQKLIYCYYYQTLVVDAVVVVVVVVAIIETIYSVSQKKVAPLKLFAVFSLLENLCSWILSWILPKHIPMSTPILVHLSKYLCEMYHFYRCHHSNFKNSI